MKIARVLNVIAIAALVGAAVTVYRIKYDATLHSENVAKLKRQIAAENDAIAVLKAEWAFLARPDRVQAFSRRHLELKPLQRAQTIKLAALPARPAPVDEIGNKLEALGLMGADASIAVETPAAAAAKKAAPPAPAKKATIAVKPASQLKAPTNRPQPKPLSTPRPGQPLNITDFLRQNPGLIR
ncbi:cell division protein FtsL [Methylopila turkensis]|uniref:Cell division protein FtsL n=1 Tax=Methylopila turkensis TaxID=1437816 RepID=A0A9W6N8F6_9HYPH|nr:hypothetical protein [Methylopila turkensis]GLK81387.1 hypothetical protein GCM10008174_31280 [Methylopila turkensis]